MSSASLQRWEYRETGVNALLSEPHTEPVAPPPLPTPPPGLTEEQVDSRVRQALEQAEQRWAAEAEEREARRREQMHKTLQSFAAERARYFREAESEVVHLALAIARKILDREASLDPNLLAALVRIALDRMGAGPVVKIRVPSAELPHWQQQNGLAHSTYICELIGDPSLTSGDCVVETDLGTANFSLDVQFKQIEQGMLDLLKRRPTSELHSEITKHPAADASVEERR